MNNRAGQGRRHKAPPETAVTLGLPGIRVMLDASALIKRYASEAGHAQVLRVFEQADGLLVAAHCQSELASALLRRLHDGCLPQAEFDRVWAAAQRDVADMVRVPLDDHVERFAFAAMERAPLRLTDALHLGSALAANVDLFVTADQRLAQLARAMGLHAQCLGEPIESMETEETMMVTA